MSKGVVKGSVNYDYGGRRTQKIVSTWNGSAYVAQSTNKFLYDGWNLIAELNHTNGLIRSYIWGLDLSGSMQGAGGVGGLLAVKPTGTNTFFVSYDGNGNVTDLIDAATGTTSGQFEYGPFGEVIRATGPSAKANPFRFSTKYTDDETDFLYYGFRYYNPSTGSWPSRDPQDETGGVNLYGFCGNDSINRLDYLGRIIVSPCPVDGFLKKEGVKFTVTKKGSLYYYYGSTPQGASLRQTILGQMMKSPTQFVLDGDSKNSCRDNLQTHLQVREKIVANTTGAKFGFAAGIADIKFNHTINPPPTVGTQDYYNSLNNTKTLIACTKASGIIFTSPLGLVSDRQRVHNMVFIPGDWALIRNAAFGPGWEQGYEGENLIAVGLDRFWGHLSQDYNLSWQEWLDKIADWPDGEKRGRPEPRSWVSSPMNGLKEMK